MPSNPQNLHTALWSSYLGFRDERAVAGFETKRKPFTSDQILGAVEAELREGEDRRQASDAVVGLAIWNLLENYLRKDPPREFVDCLQHVFSTDINTARQQFIERRSSALPPDVHGRIVDSSWAVGGNLRDTTGTLSLTVDRPFEELCGLLDPRSWTECGLLWNDVQLGPKAQGRNDLDDPTWRRKARAELTLPGGRGRIGNSTPVALDADVTQGARESIVDFEFGAAGPNGVGCHGYLSVRKVDGRPGVTLVTSQKEMRFESEVLDRLRTQTVAYWVQCEALALALCKGPLPRATPGRKAGGSDGKTGRRTKRSSRRKR